MDAEYGMLRSIVDELLLSLSFLVDFLGWLGANCWSQTWVLYDLTVHETLGQGSTSSPVITYNQIPLDTCCPFEKSNMTYNRA